MGVFRQPQQSPVDIRYNVLTFIESQIPPGPKTIEDLRDVRTERGFENHENKESPVSRQPEL